MTMADPKWDVPKKVIVLSFSQSGQLREIIDALLAPLRENPAIKIVDEVLKPSIPFPFPWSAYGFLDVFPESYREIPCRLDAPKFDPQEHFDLVIVAYQVWYLSPSIPVSSFLQSHQAKVLLKNKPVLTVVGARNMWYRAHEQVKEHLRALDAQLIGHIALTDKAFNMTSVVTVVYWMLSGTRKRLLGLFPKPGVSESDIRQCSAFGAMIEEALRHTLPPDIQGQLNQAGACRVVAHLLSLERFASRAFNIWSELILRRGGPGSPSRRWLVKIFGFYLACGIVLLSPVSFLLFYLTLPFMRPKVPR